MLRRCVAALAGLCILCIAAAVPDNVVRPAARAQTPPMPHSADSADDPAIWIHPTEPSQSLILGTDKQGALHVYDMECRERQSVSSRCMPNNVDVLYGFMLEGKRTDLALASTRGRGYIGVKAWAIDPESRTLRDVTSLPALPVFGGATPYGICVYHSPRDGRSYFFVTCADGRVEQHEIMESPGGRISARKMRSFRLSSITEGCVADDELGLVYIAEERVGIWRLDAEPDAPTARKLIARVGENGLVADVEGLTIYYGSGGKGYLIASSQGNGTFKIYERQSGNRFVMSIDPRRDAIDDVSDTDGIAVSSRPTSARFPKGLFIVQDGANSGGNQNFKVYGWENIAGDRLLIDTTWDPR